MATLRPSSVAYVKEVLLDDALQNLLDDPCCVEEDREAFAEMEALAQDLGVDIWAMAAEVGTEFQVRRLRGHLAV